MRGRACVWETTGGVFRHPHPSDAGVDPSLARGCGLRLLSSQSSDRAMTRRGRGRRGVGDFLSHLGTARNERVAERRCLRCAGKLATVA